MRVNLIKLNFCLSLTLATPATCWSSTYPHQTVVFVSA